MQRDGICVAITFGPTSVKKNFYFACGRKLTSASEGRLTPNNLLQKATGIIGGCFPENQTRSTRARVRCSPRLWERTGELSEARLLYSCAYTKSAPSLDLSILLEILLRLSISPKRSTVRRNFLIPKSVDLVRGLSSPLLCAPARRPAHLLGCSTSPRLTACPAACFGAPLDSIPVSPAPGSLRHWACTPSAAPPVPVCLLGSPPTGGTHFESNAECVVIADVELVTDWGESGEGRF
jgi:hypothetical protein